MAISIREVRSLADRQAVAALADMCRAADPGVAGRFAPAGLLAEMTSREGRAVRSWLAWRRGADPVTSGCFPLGMVSLVETSRGSSPRFSIAWLLVHPAVRRQGVATALVRQAAVWAAARGSREVAAETLPSWPAATAFWVSLAAVAAPRSADAGVRHA